MTRNPSQQRIAAVLEMLQHEKAKCVAILYPFEDLCLGCLASLAPGPSAQLAAGTQAKMEELRQQLRGHRFDSVGAFCDGFWSFVLGRHEKLAELHTDESKSARKAAERFESFFSNSTDRYTYIKPNLSQLGASLKSLTPDKRQLIERVIQLYEELSPGEQNLKISTLKLCTQRHLERFLALHAERPKMIPVSHLPPMKASVGDPIAHPTEARVIKPVDRFQAPGPAAVLPGPEAPHAPSGLTGNLNPIPGNPHTQFYHSPSPVQSANSSLNEDGFGDAE